MVKMYKNGCIPYTFDELPEFMQGDPDIILDAETSPEYTMEQMYN